MDYLKELDNVIDLAKAIGSNWAKLSTRAQYHGYNVMQYNDLTKPKPVTNLDTNLGTGNMIYNFLNIGKGE